MVQNVLNFFFIISPFSGTDYGGSGAGAVILDDCNFHESVHLDSFDMDRTLTLVSRIGWCSSGLLLQIVML